MPSRRLFLTCTCVSVLLHLLVLWLVYRFPSTVHRPEEVMEIDLSDIPRATDFLPPEPGLLEGRPPPPVRPQPSREARKEPPAPRVLEGRVPDLPVRPDLPPEKSFPPAATKAGPGAGGCRFPRHVREKRLTAIRTVEVAEGPHAFPRKDGDGARRAVRRPRAGRGKRERGGHRRGDDR